MERTPEASRNAPDPHRQTREPPLPSIIVVEDEKDLREGMVECLRLAGLQARGVGSAIEFYQELSTGLFDIAVLDVNLPDKDGYSIASFLSAKTDLGIIFISGRDQEDDRIRGFASGADLYFVKPVSTKEFVLAVSNLARRLKGERQVTAEQAAEPEKPADTWVLDRVRWRLISPGSKAMTLTAKEVLLTERLAQDAGTAVSRRELARLLGHEAQHAESRSLDATIKRMRRKAMEATEEPLPIQTVQSLGFLFSAPVRVI